MEHSHHREEAFPASPLQLPRRPLRRSHPTLTNGPSHMYDLESPFIHVAATEVSCSSMSPSQTSNASRPDSPMDEITRRQLSPPDFRQMGSFDDFRMPAFSSIASFPERRYDEDLRQLPSLGATVRTQQPANHHARHKRNTLSLGGSGEDFQVLVAAGNAKKPERRRRNKALGSAQFDDILNEVFYQ